MLNGPMDIVNSMIMQDTQNTQKGLESTLQAKSKKIQKFKQQL